VEGCHRFCTSELTKNYSRRIYAVLNKWKNQYKKKLIIKYLTTHHLFNFSSKEAISNIEPDKEGFLMKKGKYLQQAVGLLIILVTILTVNIPSGKAEWIFKADYPNLKVIPKLVYN